MTINRKDVEKQIMSIQKRGKNVQDDIQKAIIQSAQFAYENEGDFTLMTKLYNALPVMVRRATFKNYVESNMPALFREKQAKTGKAIKVFAKNKRSDAPEYSFDILKETPFYKWEPAKGDDEANPLTLEDFKKKLEQSIVRLEKQAGNNKDVVDFAEAMRKQLVA